MASPPPPPSQQAETLMSLLSPLSASLTALSSHSKSIPTSHDFHFYNNFPHFNSPIQSLSSLSASLLASSGVVPSDDDDDEKCLDAVVDANDGLIERFGAAVDEFEAGRRREEAGGEMEKDGFQLVRGRKKRNGKESGGGGGESEVRVVVKPKVPFHMPGIPRPQDQYNILINNQNVPFQHVWLETSEDGERFVHPLERLSLSSFIDKDNEEHIPTKPFPLKDTPFKLVESVNDLRELANKLCDSNEFAIDLEHNQYRSFQGLTCLMQISTRTEDFIVDTLKLRIHVGPHLREVFKDPSKRKVMHGADRDILWLERDFGIYICNLFDTGQASRVLQLERNSLEYLLHRYCDVAANKEYQNADWRLRPLPDEMIKYAREDTHYLLYIYDVMRNELLSKPNSENGSAIMEVYMRSYDICMQLYEKELLTDTSYLHIYGLREEAFTSEQLAVVAGLCEWRDGVARAEDESTGYVLPNRVLLEFARVLPLTSGKLRRLVKSKHSFLERHLGQVLNIIKSSIKNAPAFECIAEQLKKERFEALVGLNGQAMCVDSESPEAIADQDRDTLHTVLVNGGNTRSPNLVADDQKLGGDKISSNHLPVQNLQSASTSFQCLSNLPNDINGPNDKDLTDSSSGAASLKSLKRVNVASVQKLQRPSGAFGALLGNTKKKPSMDLIKTQTEQVKSEKRLEQIKSSVSLPFHSFSGLKLTIEEVQENKPVTLDCLERQQHDSCVPNTNRETEEVIMIGSGLSDSETEKEPSVADDHLKNSEHCEVNGLAGDEDVSLAEVTFGFEKCSNHSNSKRSAAGMSSKQSPDKNQVQPFDYVAARKQMNFAGDEGAQGVKGNPKRKTGSTGKGSKNSAGAHKGEAQGSEFQQPRRRQAFPASGNRSATFR